MGICKYSWSPLVWKRISSSLLSVLAGWDGGEGRGKAAAETGRGGQGSSPSLAHCPRSARFPDSHLQGQDAVVPHKRLAVTTSFKSLSGLPATIKGHVCKGEEGGGGKNSWTGRRGQPRTLVTGGAPVRGLWAPRSRVCDFLGVLMPGRIKQTASGGGGGGLLEVWRKRSHSGF